MRIMLKKLSILFIAAFVAVSVSETFAQGVRYRTSFEDVSIKVLRCAVQSDNSCTVDFLMENNGSRDWKLHATTWSSVIHVNRAYDDMGNEYSKITMAIGDTSKYVGEWDKVKNFPTGTVLKVRVKIFDVSELATELKRLDIDLCDESQWNSSRRPVTLFDIPISR